MNDCRSCGVLLTPANHYESFRAKYCKSCWREKCKQHYRANREPYLERSRQVRKRNPEAVKLYAKAYRLRKGEELRQKKREYRTKHREEAMARTKHWYRHHRARALELLGGMCQLCHSRERLEFAHIVYHGQMADPKNRNNTAVMKEIAEYPNDFLLLCHSCHRRPERHLKRLIELEAKLSEAVPETLEAKAT